MRPVIRFLLRLIRTGSIFAFATWAGTAFALPGFGAQVDSTCNSLGYPLDTQFEPQVSGNCLACHDNGASGGSGAGRSAFSRGDWEFFCPAPEVNAPPTANANGPYSGEVDLPISFSSAGSSDPDGMIVDYLWEFGDGSTSTDPNPAYAYASAAEFSVSLTVTDDFGDSHTSTTRANVSPPVIAEPDIQIDTSALDFNQVEIGTTATLAATVHNNGTELLSISGVMACAGTSSEYDWSPSTFDIEPGGSTALSVMYAPSDDLSDSGCLEIMSNDPDEGTLALGINGTGFVPAPVVADLDINRLSSSKRARLGQRRQISVSLVVTNSGLDAASANATLTATQNGIVVHEEQSMLDVAAGDQTRINFRAFTPTDSGDIEWSVSIDDEDPDVDQASAVTHVVTPKSPRSGRGNR